MPGVRSVLPKNLVPENDNHPVMEKRFLDSPKLIGDHTC